MRILHVVRGLANSSGTTHIVGPLAEAQARLGHSVRVFFVEKPKRTAVTPDPAFVESRGFPMTLPTEHLGWSRRFASALPGAIGSSDVLHVHAIWNFPTWWSMRIAHRCGVPYVVAPQGSLENWALGRSRHLKRAYGAVTERRYLERAAFMQAVTEAEAEQCRAFGLHGRVEVIPNGVDLHAIDRAAAGSALRAELNLPAEAVLVLFLGRLFPKKGLDLLIPAFAGLARERDDVHLLIAGGDAGTGYHRTVESLIRREKIQDRVRLLGELQGEQKFRVLRGADLFALTSYSEGLPIAALEAMACCKPVLVTPHCNLDDVRAAVAGWITAADIQSVLDALRVATASSQERARRGASARKLVEARYTWDHIASQSLKLYESVLKH